jgi:hypothetical protein
MVATFTGRFKEELNADDVLYGKSVYSESMRWYNAILLLTRLLQCFRQADT